MELDPLRRSEKAAITTLMFPPAIAKINSFFKQHL
jgi:hypothetical protein